MLKTNNTIVRVCICEILRYSFNNKQKLELVVKLMKLIVLVEKKDDYKQINNNQPVTEG
ncbi:hypothetical protein [Candidatus Tisiphia endosymbiont of Temnostethus pusillus]|uniref:hypothetical protein n=1 Tax=Candidatus Tisiphia endosymbiont of Temnostethus pusillus TaxID=3139335 RepID=UPI0035C90244